MALIETWFNQDLKEPVKVRYLDGNVFSADNAGNLIGVNVFSDGEPATLSGSVSASVIRADGATVPVPGALSGNIATVVLPQACYAMPGPISIVIKITTGGAVTTICAVVANVYQSSTDEIVDPGTIIPSIQDLIDAINEAIGSIPVDYSELSRAVKEMNDGGNIEFLYGHSNFYDGYYSGTSYTGSSTVVYPPFSGWNVLLVHVVKGKTITISGMPTTAGAQSVWLSSSTLTDVKKVAWNAQQCNGEHYCETEWLAMSGYQMNPVNIKIIYKMLDDLQEQLDYKANAFEMFSSFLQQNINVNNVIAGKYYWHGGKNTSDNAHTYIVPPFRVYAGVGYSFINVYGYFCTIFYDDGTSEALTDDTLSKKTIYKQMPKNGWAYITVYDAYLGDAMAVAGDSHYDGLYFVGYGINPKTAPTADMVVRNKTIAVSASGNVFPWINQDYSISGNSISYTAPASGNTGFYIVPITRENISKIRVLLNVSSSGGGTMTIHVWDTVTTSFADHLYTVESFSNSKIINIDLDYIAEQRPSMNISNWVILISNSGNGFTFNFNSISILADSDVPNVLNGKTIGEIFKIINDEISSVPLYIECGVGKQYTRLRDAIAAAEVSRGSTVVVYPGVYDLTTEFASEIAAATGSNMGIELTNDVYVKFLSGAYVKALFPNSSENISDHFQPFWSNGSGFTLDGLNIEASNCRYCVHDERGGADVKYHNVYKNCVMKFTMDNPEQSGGTSKYMQCIGGGLGKYGYIEIDGGYYETVNNVTPDSQQPISYHNGVSDGCDSKIFIKDLYLVNKGIIRLGCYGPSTIKTRVLVNGCRMYDHVYKTYEAPASYQVDNFDVIEWNNEIGG